MPRSQQPGAPRQVQRFLYGATSIATKSIIEIANPAGSGANLEVRKWKFYSLLANKLTLARTSAVQTGGTSAPGTPSQSRPTTADAPLATVKTYSVASTGGGTADATWDTHELAAAATYESATLAESETGLVIPPGYQCTVACSAVTTVEGYVEWYEDPT